LLGGRGQKHQFFASTKGSFTFWRSCFFGLGK
jgi:hypothetical protein